MPSTRLISQSGSKDRAKNNAIVMIMKPTIKPAFGLAAITALLALPLIIVLWSLLSNPAEAWAQLSGKPLGLYLFNTGALMGLVAIMAGTMGTACAWCVTAYEFPGRKWLSWALILPIAAPGYIIAYIYADLLEYYGPLQSGLRAAFGWQAGEYSVPPIRNIWGGAIMLSLVLYPYVYLLARASFLKQSHAQWWAARTLGLSSRAAFFKIALPSARPAIAGGLALVLMETLADFGVADFFAVPTFSVGIFRNWLILGDKPAALKLAGIMLLAVFLLVILEAGTRKGRVVTRGKTAAQAERAELPKVKQAVLFMLCALPVLLGAIIPILRLIYHVLTTGDGQAGSAFIRYAANSVSVALIVAALTLIIAAGLVRSRRVAPSGFNKATIRIATLGYALPGALLAVGLLAPLGVFDKSLTRFMSTNFDWSGGLILTGTILALVYALTIRFLTVSYNSVTAGFDKIPMSMEYAARSLNAGPRDVMRRIQLPLLRPSLIAAFILVFIDVLRELPATLILRPFNFDTLATRVYWLANDERLPEASLAALVIIILGALPTLYLNLYIERKNKI